MKFVLLVVASIIFDLVALPDERFLLRVDIVNWIARCCLRFLCTPVIIIRGILMLSIYTDTIVPMVVFISVFAGIGTHYGVKTFFKMSLVILGSSFVLAFGALLPLQHDGNIHYISNTIFWIGFILCGMYLGRKRVHPKKEDDLEM